MYNSKYIMCNLWIKSIQSTIQNVISHYMYINKAMELFAHMASTVWLFCMLVPLLSWRANLPEMPQSAKTTVVYKTSHRFVCLPY